MLHFFRKIRHDLIANSQTYKYLKYAIGEIVLVVLGILIALQINNWNEERKAREQTKILLDEVAQELVQNIHKSDVIIDFYISLDTFFYRVLNKEVSHEDYKSNRNLVEFTLNHLQADLVDDNFKKLINGYSSYSEELDTIVSTLKSLYGKEKKYLDDYDEMMSGLAIEIKDKLKHEIPSFSDYRNYILTDEMIEYCLTDPFYLNEVADKQYIGYNLHLYYSILYRWKALMLYEDIYDFLDLKKDSSLIKNINDFQHYLGVYEPMSADYAGVELIIKKENNSLILEYFENDNLIGTQKVSPYSKSYFFVIWWDVRPQVMKLEFDENNEVVGSIILGNIQKIDGNRLRTRKVK